MINSRVAPFLVTMSLPPSDPIQTNGTSTVRRCRRCGAETRTGVDRCVGCGSFVVGTQAALVHRLSRLRGGPSTPLDVSAPDAQIADFVAHKGGDTNLPAVLRPQLLDLAQAIQLRDAAWAHIAAVGPLTKAGRQRAATGLYLQASARAQQLAQQVGLARVPAPAQTPLDIVREYQSQERSS